LQHNPESRSTAFELAKDLQKIFKKRTFFRHFKKLFSSIEGNKNKYKGMLFSPQGARS